MAFGKGKKDAPQGNPVDLVVSLRQQGYQNEQIIQVLQSQGFKSAQIFDALNAADVGGVPGAPQQGFQQYPDMQQQMQQQQPPQAVQQMQQEAPPPYEQQNYAPAGERTEEIVEAIIEEKWNELLKDVNRIIEWTTRTETRISKMEQDIKNLRDNFDMLHRGILGKITEYDQNLVNVGTEIKAMGKVFEKVMPQFTENVQKLSRIAQGIKETVETNQDVDIEKKVAQAKKQQ